MQYFLVICFGFFTVFFNGCSNNQTINPQKSTIKSFSYITATVKEQFGEKLIVSFENKNSIDSDEYESKLVNTIIKNSLLITGMETYIGKEKALVSDIRGNQITFDIQNKNYKTNEKIKIYLPKKILAVMDFTVVGSSNDKVSTLAMEDMITKLVQSGQYIIVERAKLDTILKEQKLIDSGLLDQDSASKLGQLVSADVILTGSLIKIGSKWKINMRLLDVKSGVILSAVNDIINGKDLKILRNKDNTNLKENFETKSLSDGWKMTKRKAKVEHGLDFTSGANGTNTSYKIKYKLKEPKSTVKFVSHKVRDVSGFKGIEVWLKSQNDAVVVIGIEDQNYNDPNTNKWVYHINTTNKWEKFKIDFDYLAMANQHRRKNPGGDGIMDLDNLSKVLIQIRSDNNSLKQLNTLWIDEISLY